MAVIDESVVLIAPSFKRFRERYRAGLAAAARPQTLEVELAVKANAARFRQRVAQEMKAIADIGKNPLLGVAAKLETQRQTALKAEAKKVDDLAKLHARALAENARFDLARQRAHGAAVADEGKRLRKLTELHARAIRENEQRQADAFTAEAKRRQRLDSLHARALAENARFDLGEQQAHAKSVAAEAKRQRDLLNVHARAIQENERLDLLRQQNHAKAIAAEDRRQRDLLVLHARALQENERIDREKLAAIQKAGQLEARAHRENFERDERLAEQLRKRQERADRDRVARRRRLLSAVGGGLGGLGDSGQIIDLGRRGVRPMNALLALAVAASPALLAMASSAAMASTSLAAMGAAALGVVSGVGVLAFAFNGLGEAMKLEQQAAEGSEAAADQLNDKLAAMAPNAVRLYRELRHVKEEMRGFSQVAQQATLQGFTSFLESIRRPADRSRPSTLDLFKAGLVDMGEIISDAMARLGAIMGSPIFQKGLAQTVNENGKAFQNFADAALALVKPFTRLVAAAAPQLTRFSHAVEGLANSFADWIAGISDADLRGFFREAGDEMAKWGRIAGNLAGILRALFLGSLPAGERLADRFEHWTGRVSAFLNSFKGQQRIRGFFDWFAHLPWANLAKGLLSVTAGVVALKAAMVIGGAAAGLVNLLTGNWMALALGVAGAAAFALAAGIAYAYTQFKPFRDVVHQAGSILKEQVAPAMREFGDTLREVIAENKEELKVLGELLGFTLIAGAKGLGIALSAALRQAAFWIKVTSASLGLLAKAFYALIAVAAEFGRKAVDAFQTAGNAAFRALEFIDPLGFLGLDEANRRFNEWADATKREMDDVADYARATIHRMATDHAGNLGQALYESQVPALARRARTPQEAKDYQNALDLAKAKDELSAALRRQARAAKEGARTIAADSDALRDARIAARDAAWEVGEAERALADAHRDVRDAQREVNDARKEAAEDLRRLRLEVRGLAADEEAARLKLDVAREVRKGFEYSSSVDPLFRRQLDLDVKQSEQELAEQLEESRRKRNELTVAERKGIENSDKVRQARDRLRDATANVVTQERNLIRANEGVRKAQDELREATIRNNRVRGDAARAYDTERAAVETARRKIAELSKEINAVPGAKTTTFTAVPQVKGLTAEQLARRDALIVIGNQKLKKENRLAGGGAIHGAGTKTSDSVPIWASRGEFMQPAKSVDYYGVTAMEAIRQRRVPRELFSPVGGFAAGGSIGGGLKPAYLKGITSFMASQQAAVYAEKAAARLDKRRRVGAVTNTFVVPATALAGVSVGSFGKWPPSPAAQRGDSGVWRSIVALVKSSGIRHQFGNAYRPGDDKWHGSGRAVDYMGYNQDRLGQFFMGIRSKVLELIHTTDKAGYYITRGIRQRSMGEQDELHRNHLHVAMARGGLVPRVRSYDTGGGLPPGVTVAVNRTGRTERVRNAAQEAALSQPTRLDKRDIKLLAAYIAQASGRPIDIDGRRVAEAVNAYTYLPAGV